MYDTKEYQSLLQECGFVDVAITTLEKEYVFPSFYRFLVEQEQKLGSIVKSSVFMQLKMVALVMKFLSNWAGIDMILVTANKPK
jgi:hypothetical protein